MSSSESARHGVSNFALTTSSWLPGKYRAPTYSFGEAPFTAKLSSFIESSILTSSVTEVADLESWADAAVARSRIAARAILLNRRIVRVMCPPGECSASCITSGRPRQSREEGLADEKGVFFVGTRSAAARRPAELLNGGQRRLDAIEEREPLAGGTQQ